MKKFLIAGVACVFAFCTAYIIASRQITARHAAELAQQQSEWQAERTALESALDEARNRPQLAPLVQPPSAPSIVTVQTKTSPQDLIARLRNAKFTPGAGQLRVMRQVIHDLDDLIAAGPAALPVIGDYLSRNEDVEFNSSTNSRAPRDVPLEFLVPPSLRFGLFDVVKQIGGPDAERILADTLNTSGRASEITWLARALQEMAPDKYRDAALLAARGVLERATELKPSNGERDQAFKVLTMFNDGGYVATAQSQLIRADGQVDNAALQYLLKTLGPQAVSLAAQLYDDPRITDPQKKEPFARVALNYVGADAAANAFYVKAINDPGLSNDQRRNLIEDLNQDGFIDRRNLNATRDLPLIDNRLSIIQQLAPGTTDPVNAAALKEAYKDLVKMRERVTRPPVQ